MDKTAIEKVRALMAIDKEVHDFIYEDIKKKEAEIVKDKATEINEAYWNGYKAAKKEMVVTETEIEEVREKVSEIYDILFN